MFEVIGAGVFAKTTFAPVSDNTALNPLAAAGDPVPSFCVSKTKTVSLFSKFLIVFVPLTESITIEPSA